MGITHVHCTKMKNRVGVFRVKTIPETRSQKYECATIVDDLVNSKIAGTNLASLIFTLMLHIAARQANVKLQLHQQNIYLTF